MKILDVLGTGVKVAAKAVVRPIVAAVASAPARPRDRDAEDELARRAAINARAARRRSDLDAALFGGRGWLGHRRGWLERGR